VSAEAQQVVWAAARHQVLRFTVALAVALRLVKSGN
jgi:hypothetical protein